MAPQTAQRTAFEKYDRAYTGAVVKGKAVDGENTTCHAARLSRSLCAILRRICLIFMLTSFIQYKVLLMISR